MQEELKGLLKLAAKRMKRFYDAWVDEAPNYMVEDHVYLEHADLCSNRLSHKLDFGQFGPFRMSQKTSDTTYHVSLPNG